MGYIFLDLDFNKVLLKFILRIGNSKIKFPIMNRQFIKRFDIIVTYNNLFNIIIIAISF